MNLKNYVSLEQNQKLVLTPILKQSLEILQCSQAELKELIHQELLDNPVLMINEEFNRAILNLTSRKIYSSKQNNLQTKDEYPENYRSTDDQGLIEHLLEQVHTLNVSQYESEIIEYIIGNINKNGYLDLNPSEITSKYSISKDKAVGLIKQVQTLDPVGVAGKDLRECLMIQLEQKNLTKTLAYDIVNTSLEDLAENRLQKIAKEYKVSISDINKAKEKIASLEPNPGRCFSSSNGAQYLTPDIIVTKVNGKYQINLTRDNSISNLNVDSFYKNMLKKTDSLEVSEYIQKKIQSALDIINSIQQRDQTIKKVSTAIVNHQIDFFEKGRSYIKPLTMKEIAQELNIHESTVSRAISGKYMESPRGVYKLKFFFQSGIKTSSNVFTASETIKKMIKEIIAKENVKKPFSDSYIAEQLNQKGIIISRRCVAKYRDSLNILSSSKRKVY